MRKSVAWIICLLLIIVVLSLTLSETALASIPKPSVPQFTVKLFDSSYDVPATTTIDPYTGKTVTPPAAHIEARTIEIAIENEPFTSFWIQKGGANWSVSYYYNIRYKGHFEED